MSIRVEAQERDRQRRQVRGAAAGDGGDGNVVEEWRRAVHNVGEQLAVQTRPIGEGVQRTHVANIVTVIHHVGRVGRRWWRRRAG